MMKMCKIDLSDFSLNAAKWRQLYHDGVCVCKDAFGCIMAGEVSGASRFYPRMFSSCSKSDQDVSLSMGITSCLWGAPQVFADLKQVCGNGIVERGEECDCGTPEECISKDLCCDPSTCLLQPWAQCRSGPCCNNCLYMSTAHMCRPRQSECDIPEFCDGQSGDCPFNTYIEDGHPCAHGKGYCMGGICPMVHKQCQGIWGTGANGGHEQCFQRFNPTGNFNGHCGKDKLTGSYARCQHSDILCGLLHCEGGRSSPMYGSDKGFSTTNVNANNMEYECKTVHGPAMMDMPYMGMVQDGTKCGPHRICLHNSCVQLPSIPVITCPSINLALICSGHGVCGPNDICFCDHGWEGMDCSVKSNITVVEEQAYVVNSVASFTTPEVKTVALSEYDEDLIRNAQTPTASPVTEDVSEISSSLMIVILAPFVASMFLAMGVTLFFYRRKNPVKTLPDIKCSGKSKKKRYKKSWGEIKKLALTEDDNELDELPPPPVIVVCPGGLMPEKGILKNYSALDHRGSSDSNTGSNKDQDSEGLYIYEDDEDVDAEEICSIFHDDSTDNMDNLQDSASFDFVIPPPPQPPPPQFPLPDYYPSPALFRKGCPFDSGMLPPYENHYMPPPQKVQLLPQQTVPTWRSALPPQTLTPPQSRIVRLRNLTDYMHQFNNKATIDLSPSPDELQNQQLSPSTCTSEDVRSSETEPDRAYNRTSNSDHSPTSVTSNSTQHTAGPSFGSLSQYLLKRTEAANKIYSTDDNSTEQCVKQMNFYESKSMAETGPGYNQNSHQNDLSGGFYCRSGTKISQDLPSFDMPPPMSPLNFRNIFSQVHTPCSSVSRDSNTTTLNGDNNFFMNTGKTRIGYDKSSGYCSEQDHDRASNEDNSYPHSNQSHLSLPPSYSAVIRTGPNRIQLVPAGPLVEDGQEIEGIQRELSKLLENLPRINAGSFERSPLYSNTTSNTPLTSSQPSVRLHKDELPDNNAPCIDRSLEEIPAHFSDTKKSEWSGKTKRPVSMAVQGVVGENSSDSN